MKALKIIILAFLPLWGFEYSLQPVKVANNVYCFFGALENISKVNAGNMVNTCFIQTKQGFIVIDSGPTFAYAEQAYTQMQKIAKLPVKYVIITHDHDDHWLGNSFYKSKGALLIGPRTYQQNIVVGMQTRMQDALGKKLYGKTKIVKLDRVVDNNLTLELGSTKVEVKQWVKKAHTEGDLIIYLPKQKVLFGGDTIFNGRLTSLREGSIIGSIKILEQIEALEAKVIIGGHGYKTDTNATKVLKMYLLEMKEEILEALDNDVSIDEITQKVTMPKYKGIKLYDILHSRNVFEAYRELEIYEEEEE